MLLYTPFAMCTMEVLVLNIAVQLQIVLSPSFYSQSQVGSVNVTVTLTPNPLLLVPPDFLTVILMRGKCALNDLDSIFFFLSAFSTHFCLVGFF